MNSFLFSLLMAMPQGTGGEPAGGPMGSLMSFLPLIAIVAIFYFLILRPQNKKQKETQKMLAALKKGDKVVTIGGIHGTIQAVRESTVIVRVDDNTKIEFSRSAVSSVESQAKEEKKIESAEEEKAESRDDKEKKE